jgi:predicted DNA binding CopG/RHH family protein
MSKRRTRQFKRVERPEDIPVFTSEEEEARFWSEHELGDEFLARMEALGEDILPATRTRPISVRFDEDVLQRLKRLASELGKPYQTLLKQFVLERLYEEERRESMAPAMWAPSVPEGYYGTGPASRSVHRRASKGSQWQVQTYINWRAGDLQSAIENEVEDLRGAEFEWVSPLTEHGFREFRDADFLSRVGLEQHARALRAFWPVRGPVWDALAIVQTKDSNQPGVLLIEAKSHPGEMLSAGSRAKARASVKRIHAALKMTQSWLGVSASPDDWMGELYQHGNRLAHLYWLNEVVGRKTWLVYLLFVDDHEHRATTADEWKQAIRSTTRQLDLERKKVPQLAYVLVPALQVKEFDPTVPSRVGRHKLPR